MVAADEGVVIFGSCFGYEARLAMPGGEMDLYTTLTMLAICFCLAVAIFWSRDLL